MTDLPQSNSLLNPEVTTLVPLLICSVNSSAGRRSHGRVGDDGCLFAITAALGLNEPEGYLALPDGADLLG